MRSHFILYHPRKSFHSPNVLLRDGFFMALPQSHETGLSFCLPRSGTLKKDSPVSSHKHRHAKIIGANAISLVKGMGG